MQHKGHHGAIGKNDERKNQVKFVRCHIRSSDARSHLVTGRSSNSRKIICGTGIDACDGHAGFCYAENVLWADGKSKPYKNNNWGLSLATVCKLTLNE
jgi:hypothetical protein